MKYDEFGLFILIIAISWVIFISVWIHRSNTHKCPFCGHKGKMKSFDDTLVELTRYVCPLCNKEWRY